MQFLIRSVMPEDAQEIVELSAELGYETTAKKTLARLLAMGQNPNHQVYVAVEGEKVVGWIHGFYALRVEAEPFVEIGGLVVGKAHRKKGIGASLIEKLEAWGRQNEETRLRVRCNLVRKESHKFYQKLGFTVQKNQKIFEKTLIVQ